MIVEAVDRGRVWILEDSPLEAEMARRKVAWKKPPPKYPRGYGAMFSEHIGQADQGCDLDFLQGKAVMPEPEIH